MSSAANFPVLVLASTSPRRRELLARIGLVPSRIAAPEIDETPLKAELPRDYVARLAKSKALAVERAPDEVVLAGDTTVTVGRRILEKPADEADLRRMLGLLSGRRHHVYSGICVVGTDGKARVRVVDTVVAFKALSAAEIDRYVESGEGMGKAGGYAIQGRAETFVRFLSGSHSNVVGLPLFETRALLTSAGIALG
ncbi:MULTISPECIES: Maf family protein [unclassified Sphingopyxis]|uniref:Maf family protein n=1 Tax=unclassified Sphingopyxis TaxID=2614943 RepID=UPI002854A625|nr:MULTISPECIES: Maf family protein [unclassified Sphingopyxis]MDR7061901.1 septum formation protein [Sphingopyxis sp. BE235]MDR7182154.1 septum formation protein [Sphingopyxis sp. BE249]